MPTCVSSLIAARFVSANMQLRKPHNILDYLFTYICELTTPCMVLSMIACWPAQPLPWMMTTIYTWSTLQLLFECYHIATLLGSSGSAAAAAGGDLSPLHCLARRAKRKTTFGEGKI